MNKIESYLDQHFANMIQVTQRLINLDSHPDDVAGVQKVVDMLTKQIKSLGMSTRQLDPGQPGTVLVGELAGPTNQAPVILLGHLDTVFAAGSAKRRPFALDGDKMTGPGIYDMKPGLVVGLFAIQALKELGLVQRPIKMIIVSDEEKLHMHSHAYQIIADESKGAAYGLNLEGSPAKNIVHTHNRGGAILGITVHGKAAHSGAAPEKGRNAILELAHRIIKYDALTDLANGIHVNCGVINGGQSENIIPDLATTSLGIRFKTNDQRDQLIHQIQAIASKPTVPGTHTTVSIRTKIDSMEATPAVQQLFARLNQVSQEIGNGELTAANGGGASDAGIMVARGVPTIDSLGIVGGGAHTEQEYASAHSLIDRANLIANFIASDHE